MNALMDAALAYLAQGLHPIPCRPREKRPLVKWEPYQHRPPRSEEIKAWWSEHPDANIGLVLGRGIFAVDCDGPMAEALLRGRGILLPAEAPRNRTARGHHTLLGAPHPIPDCTGLLNTEGIDGHSQVDIKGVGLIIAPPSVHPTGHVYRWEVPLTLPVPSAPLGLLRLIEDSAARPSTGEEGPGWVVEALRGVGKGERDDLCTRLAGYFLGKGVPREIAVELLVQGFARNCAPPFPEAEVRKVVWSIADREARASGHREPPRPVPIREMLDDLTATLNAEPPAFVRTPFPALNKLLCGGFAPGELVYVGGRPGMGKTAFGLELARCVAKQGVGVLVVSREMVLRAMARRVVSQEGRVSASALRQHTLTEEEWGTVEETIRKLRDLPLWFTDAAMSMAQIEAVVRAHDATPPLGLVVVDYLQLIRGEGDDRRLEVEGVSQRLKALAVDCKFPVVCLSSLSRPLPGKNARPTLASLRESGELEHDADFVMFLHRPEEQQRTAGARDTEAIIAKGRDAGTGTVHLRFREEFVTFEEPSARREPE